MMLLCYYKTKTTTANLTFAINVSMNQSRFSCKLCVLKNKQTSAGKTPENNINSS